MSVTGYVGLLGAAIAATAVAVHVIDTRSSGPPQPVYVQAAQADPNQPIQQPVHTTCINLGGVVSCDTH